MNKMNELLKLVEDSETFKDWKNEHKNSYLCAFFRIIGNTENPEWQVHYYEPRNDTISVFKISAKISLIENEAQILKNDSNIVEELNLDDVDVDLFHALQIVDNFQINNYPKEIVVKKIIILQKLKKTVWNITCLTSSFNLLNIKVDTKSGEIIEESVKPLINKVN